MRNKTTDELLQEVYMAHPGDKLMQELAKRLEEAIDEIATLKEENDES